MKGILALIIFAIITGFTFNTKSKINEVNNSYRSFALLELYTSEGCSSCPSADKLLPQLASIDSGVITLSFHVDYWNRLGWTDKFSKPEFTNRQREYGQQFNLESIYTPQLIINGQYELVGSNRSGAEADIKTALNEKAAVQLFFDEVKREGEKLNILSHVEGNLKDQNIFLAIVQKHAETSVRAGENGGRKLLHTNIVRALIKRSAEQKMVYDIAFPKDIANDNWSLVLFTQHKSNFRITGAITYHQ